ncbi:Tim44 domain-containing protein [Vreelandella massiliensis]|uniref:Tim44 domain-containing protein n=1 Tax=Vreelandella massiliensis TaxID=1816686 RepID=UPI00096A9C3E|nr:Tim44-like domain-containing protein [Halomonas massiliensis]
MVRQFFIMLLVSVLSFSAAVEYAEARRMGGGSSTGSFSRSADRPASTPSQQQAQSGQQSQAGAAAARRSGMGGMLGGLLAGGLFAALFFGGAFDELRLMDLLVMAGVAALAVYAFRALRQRRPLAASSAGQQASTAPSTAANFDTSAAPGSLGAGLHSTPAWFDKERFLSGAKEHFMTLQRAWDNNDFSRIQEYVTPELYNLLREERAQHPANNRTDIVRLFAELGDVQEFGGKAEATVIFHGLLEENGTETEFNETWHLVRDLRDEAPWYIQGIEQNPAH